jgi:hypothetical protein
MMFIAPVTTEASRCTLAQPGCAVRPLQRWGSRVAVIAVAGLLLLSLSACQKEGPAERAGKEVDEVIDKAGAEVEKAGEAIRDAAEDARK